MRYTSLMKLSQYAKQQGISYRTALRWWRAGAIKGYQAPTRTIIVTEGEKPSSRSEHVAIYTRDSSAEHQENLERQAARLKDYCAARKAAELVKQVSVLPITVTRLPPEQLLRRAVESSNAFHGKLLWERGHDYERAIERSDPAFLERITVNSFRHYLTAYDTHLEEVAGQIGVNEATSTIGCRVYAEIAARHPEDAEECKRQMRARHGEAS